MRVTLGAPEITPVLVSKFMPAGRLELIEKEVTFAAEGAIAGLGAVPRTRLLDEGEYARVGAGASTVRFSMAEAVPATLVAVTW